MRDTAGQVRTNLYATIISGPFHMDVQVLDDQQELIHYSSVGKSMLAARYGEESLFKFRVFLLLDWLPYKR